MPGVPSGRGCDGCRKQKKKCDQAKPACGRCTRLSLECAGGGVQRYIFKEPKAVQWRDEAIRGAHPTAQKSASRTISPAVERPVCSLSATLVSFISVINPADDAQYSLCWAYGPYLLEVPSRLGHNRALDTAAEALVGSHATACRRQPPSLKCLSDYSRALAALRESLNDPDTARSAETLCAIMLLLMCQTFIGVQGSRWGRWTGHCEGAVQLLRAKGRVPRDDSFEQALLLSLWSTVLCEAVFNDRIVLVPDDWTRLIVEPLGKDNPGVTMISFVWEMQDLIRRWREVSVRGTTDPSLLLQARHRYHAVTSAVSLWRERTEALRASCPGIQKKGSTTVQIEAVFHRIYGFHIAIALLTAAIVTTICGDSETSAIERGLLSRQALEAATQCALYGPLAANLSPLVLGAAFIAAPTNSIQAQTRAAYVQFYETSVPPVDRETAITELEYSSAMFWRTLA